MTKFIIQIIYTYIQHKTSVMIFKGDNSIHKNPHLFFVEWGWGELSLYGLLGGLELGTEFTDRGQILQQVLFVFLSLSHGLLQVTDRACQVGYL